MADSPATSSKSGGDAVEGDVVRVTFENPSTGFRVLRVAVRGRADPLPVVGVFPSTPPGSRIRATGKLETSPKHGEQFRAETLITVAPETLDGLVRFLGSGMIPGIGPAFAQRVVSSFGTRTLEILDHHPGRLREVAGLGKKRAESLARAWKEHQAVAAIMVFLQAHGASPALATRIYRHFGVRAMEVVNRSPYRLALEVPGIGFKTADRIAQTIGIAGDSPERVQAGVLQTLHDVVARGHVYAQRSALTEAAATMLEVDVTAVESALAVLTAGPRVVEEDLGDECALFLSDLHADELRVAERLVTLLSARTSPKVARALTDATEQAIAGFERAKKVQLAPAQRDAILLCATQKVVVITGGPGVGKTTIVRAVLAAFSQARLRVRLAAPTGRAAKRMSEATGREAVTMHRLLEFDPKTRSFLRNDERPLDVDAVIVDEASMVDLPMARALLDALPDEARLVWVGDVDQLPSVGPGAVLRDVIDSERIPTARLTHIFRQADESRIVESAHRIRIGEAPIGEEGKSGQFYWVPRRDAEAAADSVLEVVTKRIPTSFGLSPARDVQVLTPMHSGPVGTAALNERLQAALNPHGVEVTRAGRTLRTGDKVMQLRNDYDRDVYNGDVGFVSRISTEERRLWVDFDGREVEYEDMELDDLTLAYAITIHKSQGSEYAAVVIPLLSSHFVMLSRNLLYTAVTRGKRLVVLVADPRAVHLALAEVRKELRLTRLGARLRAPSH